MNTHPKSEQGQAIVLIVFAMIAMFALVALAMDGGQALSDRRRAQNAADSAAMAAALSYQMENGSTAHVQQKVLAVALENGYPNALPRSTVTVNANGTPVVGICPGNKNGKDFVVTIQSNLNTWFAAIFGVTQVHNTVTATARGCELNFRSFYDGNAIVSLAPVGTVSFNASGNANWKIACDDGTVSGGIFANGDANRNGSAVVTSPSLTVVGTGTSDFSSATIPQIQAGQPYAFPGDIVSKMPDPPACNGTAILKADGKYYPEPGKDGSVIPVAINGDQTYTSGLYCVNAVSSPWHGTLTARDATFYINIPNFDLKFAGNGDGFDITAQQNGDYAGYAIILPLTCAGPNGHDIICDLKKLKKGEQTIAVCNGQNDTPRLDLRGNGTGGITGAILAPTACVTMYGNSAVTNHGQITGYVVDGGGTADINVCFKAAENPQELVPPTVQLLK